MTDIVDNNRFAPPKAQLAEPGSLEDRPVLAGRFMRFIAVFLDGILMSFIVWPLFFVFGGGMSLFAPPADPGSVTAAYSMMGKMFGAMVPGYLAAAVIQAWSLHAFGGTLGKKIMGLRIVRADGTRATWVRLFFGRGSAAVLPCLIPLLGGLYALVDMLLIFRDSRQCLHDQIADTIVVTAASSMSASLEASKKL
jgi:uncharacterized RDD family membrane protein YckC